MPQVIWTKLLATNGNDSANSITTGSDGAIYVTGGTGGYLDGQTNSGGQDAFVTKYNTDGTKAWTRILGTNGYDEGFAITRGSDGAIYVAGDIGNNLDGQTYSGGLDGFVTKYNTDGTKAWTKLLGTTGNDRATSLTTGSDGAIYVAGHTDGNLDGQTSNGFRDAFVTKYNTDGTKAWTKLLPGTGTDYSTSLTTGSDGAIYVAGYTDGNLDGQRNSGGYDAFVAKYNTDGTKAWIKVIGTTGTDVANSLTTDSNGAIYVAGYTTSNLDGQTNSGGQDAFVTKYNTDGTKAWTRLLGTTGDDRANSLTTGSDGAIYVAGYTYGNLDGQTNSGGQDAFVTKYNTDGTKAWTKLLGSISTDKANSLTRGSDGAIYVAGSTYGNLNGQTNSGGQDAFVIKLKVNDAPVITSAATATFAENGTGTVYTVTATDADANTTLTYSLSGTDANLFDINNGIVTFKTAPNFELPSDSGANNVYDINVIASDGILNTTKAVAITVTNVNDDFQSALSYTLNSSQQDLILTGAGNINGTGNSLNNTIFGNSGNNVLNGGAGADSLLGNAGNDTLMGGLGADTMTGGTGNDWYWVDNAGDIVIEFANEGTDKVFTTISYTLTDNVEDLALQETAGSINGTGNGLNNTITDNTKDNLLDGGDGNDIIRASGGNDTLTGGLGTDTLTGGLGNDRFVYTDLTHSLLAGIDSIKDFNNGTETDRFVVSTARSVFNTVSGVTGLNATAIGNVLTTSNFGANAAALFTIGSKSYVAINDSTAGFSATSDAIVDITGYKGTLSTSSFVTV